MSVKRQATSELNHDNWNEDDPAEAKEMGQFRTAAKDVLEKRVIRTARRKNPMSSEANKSVFSGFGGFNKTQPSSFDFLANLTNGTKNTNGSTGPGVVTTMPTGLFTGGSIGLGPITTVTPGLFTSGSIGPALVTTVSTGLFTSGSLGPGPVTTVSTGLFTSGSLGPGPVTTVTTSLFTSKPPSANAGIFGIQTSTTPMSSGPTTMTSPFGSTVKTSPSSFFSMTKADGTKETPFKIQPITSSQIDITKSTGPTPPSVFGVPTTSANDSKQLFSSKNSTPFNKEPASSTNDTMIQASLGTSTKPAVNSVTPEKKDDSEKSNEKTIKYYSKLKGLNESVSDWINKHVAQTPLCILSPIFKDYEKYLKEITEEYQTGDKEVSENDGNNSGKQTDKTQDVKTSSPFTNNKTGSSPFSNNSSEVTKASMPFGINNSGASSKINSFGQENKMSTPFGVNNNAPSPFTNQNTNTTSPFAIKNVGSSPLSNQEAKSSPFGVNNTSSPQFTSPNAKISSPFGINNAGASPLNSQEKASTPFGINNSSPFNSNNSSAAPKLLFGSQSTVAPTSDNKAPTFSFGGNSATNATNTSTPNTGFSFGVTPSATSTSASPFVLNTNTSGNTAGSAPFSFGSGKPFSFAPNTVQQPSSESAAAENEDDEPPKVEYTPVKEDNSVYEKKCKIFVKKDNNFADKGVGTLYIKKIEGNVKHQLLVRANTNLGTVLLNLVLAEGIPAQRMGKNNVMLVCIPTPDAKPPPTPILIRVKTGEEADELLETLNKYKA